MAERSGKLRLAEEIADQLGRVVPPGIFEIEESCAATVVDQRIVKTEIRRRDDFVPNGVGQRNATFGGLPDNSGSHILPDRVKPAFDKDARLLDMWSAGIEFAQSRDAAVHGLEMTAEREASFRRRRKQLRLMRRLVDGDGKFGSLPDEIAIDAAWHARQ